MRPIDSLIEEVLKQNLDDKTPSISFKNVWNEHRKDEGKMTILQRIKAVPRAAVVALFLLLVLGFAFKPTFDKVDYPFVNDSGVIGKWETVDSVKNIEDFKPGQQIADKSDLWITEMMFVKEGKIGVNKSRIWPSDFQWTKGLIICKPMRTAAEYKIKNIEGKDYLFCAWKNGDYTYLHRTPNYFVLTKVDSQDYSNYEPTRIEDKVDYAFEDDPGLIGKWECVDRVKNIDEFDPRNRIIPSPLFLKELDIFEKGTIDAYTMEKKLPDGMLTWTKGLILCKSDKTASKYEIKEVAGDTYLFYEFKSGDYMYGGAKPDYFVLKKVD